MPETQPTNTAPPQPGDEPLPGYRLLAPLGRGGYGEVWKCEAPGGLHKAVKFVQGAHGLEGGADVPAAVELRAIERVRAIRHPFLLSLERVEPCGGGLVIVLELADRSLADLVEEQRKAGRPGLARARLLDFLREAAEALDFLNLQHHLLHLDVKPQNLFVIANHVKLGDFSRVHALPPGEEQAPVEPGAFAPLYAPPEVFRNTATRQSDQYSLAIVYQELLTGAFPFQGASARHLLVQHLQGEPDLQSLPAGDRAAVARALAKAPAERFPSCLDFVHALAGGPAELISPPPIAISPVQNPGPEPPALAGDAPALESPEELTLLECVRRTPLTEVYRAQRADGGERLVQVLFGWAGNAADLAGRLNGLHHPALAPRQVAADGRGGLAVVTPPAGRCLRDRLQECLAAGQPGVGRDELLRWLHAAAEVLDFLQQRQKLAHLALHPRNLLLDEGRLRIADFGLVELLWLPAGQPVASLNSRYAAPELAAGQAGPACDQYSLALIYHEMLTGGLPARQAGRPAGLDRLNEADRPVIARALLADPGRRWPNCLEMVRALAGGPGGQAPAGPPASPTGEEPAVLQAWFATPLHPGQVRPLFADFCRQWDGVEVKAEPEEWVYHLPAPRTFWERWTGRRPGLEVRIVVQGGAAGGGARVGVQIRPHGRRPEEGGQALHGVAPLLIESVRSLLRVSSRRGEERVAWRHPVRVSCVGPGGEAGPGVECQGRDISAGGISFYMPGALPTADVLVHLPHTPGGGPLTLPARVVRIQACGEGWYEVGAVLARPGNHGGGEGRPATDL